MTCKGYLAAKMAASTTYVDASTGCRRRTCEIDELLKWRLRCLAAGSDDSDTAADGIGLFLSACAEGADYRSAYGDPAYSSFYR
jgi:hypothetical protein